MKQITMAKRRFYRLWNEECAAWETYKLQEGRA